MAGLPLTPSIGSIDHNSVVVLVEQGPLPAHPSALEHKFLVTLKIFVVNTLNLLLKLINSPSIHV